MIMASVMCLLCRWCGPCKTLAPILEGAVQNRGGRVELAKVDIDSLQDLAMDYKVNAAQPLPC